MRRSDPAARFFLSRFAGYLTRALGSRESNRIPPAWRRKSLGRVCPAVRTDAEARIANGSSPALDGRFLALRCENRASTPRATAPTSGCEPRNAPRGNPVRGRDFPPRILDDGAL